MGKVVVVLVYVVNHFEFPDGDKLWRIPCRLLRRLLCQKKNARRANVPVIYVNWIISGSGAQTPASCLIAYATECAGKPFVKAIQPDEQDYCVLKPMHSALTRCLWIFCSATLNILSNVPARLVMNSCVLCKAHDATGFTMRSSIQDR